jgi:Ankyrin repeats (3 copies)/Ankyrin repeat
MALCRPRCCSNTAGSETLRQRRGARPQRPPATDGATNWLTWWQEAQNAEAVTALVAMPWASIHAVDASTQRTALHRAVKRHDSESVSLLLRLGLDVEAVDTHRQTPLLLLLSRSEPCLSCLTLLLDAGANLGVQDDRSSSLIYCARRGSLAALQMLLSRPEAASLLEQQDQEGKSALFWASTEGQRACVDALLQAGANVEAPSVMGVTPLRAAVSRGGPDRMAVVTRLLDAGARVDGLGKRHTSFGAPSARAQRNLIDVARSVHGDDALAILLEKHAARTL